MDDEARRFARALVRASVLKQAKLREIVRLLGPTQGLTCLDLGGDNGVVSLLLRERGGVWHSADLDETSVGAIRALVGANVWRIDGIALPFDTASFDRVVVVDLLEHVRTDRELVAELHRVLRPSGRLLVNVPNRKPRSILHRLRHVAGQTDEAHGHVRPGYSLPELRDLLAPHFEVTVQRTYSRAFSEGIDTVLAIVYGLLGARGGRVSPSLKGTVVTCDDARRHGGSFALLRAAGPLLRAVAWLDGLLVLQPGYKLLVEARPVRVAS